MRQKSSSGLSVAKVQPTTSKHELFCDRIMHLPVPCCMPQFSASGSCTRFGIEAEFGSSLLGDATMLDKANTHEYDSEKLMIIELEHAIENLPPYGRIAEISPAV